MLPLVSIIIPCYNQGHYLADALDSVVNQTYLNWECVIVNDGSSDFTENVALDWCSKDSRIKYFRKENGGLSSARNYGISNSQGEYIIPLDADDKIGNQYIQLAIEEFLKDSNTTLVYCLANYFGDRNGSWDLPVYNYEKLLMWNMIFCSAVYKREDYNKTSGYRENMIFGYEDWDFWLSLLDEKSKVFCIPEVCFFYRFKENSMSIDLHANKNLKLMYIQLYNNNTLVYTDKFGTPIEILRRNNELETISDEMKTELEKLERMYNSVCCSRSYKLGKIILRPLFFIKGLMYKCYR